jgi:hypothetical protein
MVSSRPLRLVGRTLVVGADQPIAGWVDERLADLVADPALPPAAGASTRRLDITATGGLWRLTIDGVEWLTVPTPSDAFDQLVGLANAEAARSTGVVVLHAAAAARDGRAAVLAAPSGHGKTVLVGGLVRRGWGYLSDELAPLTLSGTVLPYPKPLTIKRGGLSLVTGDEPDADQQPSTARCYLRPVELGGVLAPETPLGAVLVVAHQPGPFSSRPLGPTAACLALAAQIHTPSTVDLAALGQIAATVPGFVATVHDLDEAAAALADVLRSAVPHPDARAEAWPAVAAGPVAATAGSITATSVLGPAAGVHGVRLADGGVLHQPGTGQLVALNELGAAVWPLLDLSTPLAATAEQLATIFATAPGTVLTDLVALARQLATRGVLSSA